MASFRVSTVPAPVAVAPLIVPTTSAPAVFLVTVATGAFAAEVRPTVKAGAVPASIASKTTSPEFSVALTVIPAAVAWALIAVTASVRFCPTGTV